MLWRADILVAAAFLLGGFTDSYQKAEQDRAQFPPEQRGTLYYFDTAPYQGEEAIDVARGLSLMIASSSRQQVIEHCTPQPVPGSTLLRIDLVGLGWSVDDWAAVLREYPYRLDPEGTQIVFRADWFLVQLADAHESDAYYRLMFGGGKQPARKQRSDGWSEFPDGFQEPAPRIKRIGPSTRDDALTTLGVLPNSPFDFGMIEGKSGVSKQGIRWIENRAIARGYAWGTRDILEINRESDPLEHPDGGFQHDGEEWIVGIPKHSLNSGLRGALQVYFLANGQGKIVDRAPVDLVEDKTKFRGKAEIRVPGSCVQCHKAGLNPPTRNELRHLVKSGVEYYRGPGQIDQQQIEAFHFADLQREIERNQDDYAIAVSLVCNVENPADAVKSFTAAINRYDAPVTLAAAGRDFGLSEDEMRQAIATSVVSGSSRLVSLAHGEPMPRTSYEGLYYDLQAIAQRWIAENK